MHFASALAALWQELDEADGGHYPSNKREEELQALRREDRTQRGKGNHCSSGLGEALFDQNWEVKRRAGVSEPGVEATRGQECE